MDNENVKEKLNTLIHKKLSEHSSMDSCDSYQTVQIKQEHFDQDINGSSEADLNSYQQDATEIIVALEDRFKHISLHEVLNEKKKALLRNPEIIDLLLRQSKS